jgi:hypothetical protein
VVGPFFDDDGYWRIEESSDGHNCIPRSLTTVLKIVAVVRGHGRFRMPHELHARYLRHPIRSHYRLTDVAQCMKRQRELAVLRPKSGSGHGRRKGLANVRP